MPALPQVPLLVLATMLVGCSAARSTDVSIDGPATAAFDRAPPQPSDYYRAGVPNDFAGLNQLFYPDAPMPPQTPEPPAVDEKKRLQTLDVLSLGLSIEMLRQGDVWRAVKNAPDVYSSVLPPPESERYRHSDDPGVWEKRQDDALELVLKKMVEAWPIPTLTVYRARTEELSPRLAEIHRDSINNMRMSAGLHWSEINQLDVIYSDTPENVVEQIFRTFERHPDLPAMLVYVKGPGGRYEDGKRVHGAPIATYAAMVVGMRERADWLRPWAPYTLPNVDEWWPQFNGWKEIPPRPFRPTPFFPTPWTKSHFKQWDALPALAHLHRPAVASFAMGSDSAQRRKQKQAEERAALVAAWKEAAKDSEPARVFFDAGKAATGMATLGPVLTAVQSDLDLMDPKEGIDLNARLGDMGPASPFVGLILATMAAAESGTPSIVVPLRREDQATFMLVTPPNKKVRDDAFDVKLMPQISQGNDMPREAPPHPEENYVRQYYNDPREVAESKRIIDEYLNSVPPGKDDV